MKTKLLSLFFFIIANLVFSQVPTNDDCNMAINIPIETMNAINTSYSNVESTLSVSGSCENNTYTDLWFEFTMPVTGNVRITNAYGNDVFILFDSCTGTEIQCGFGNEYYYNLQQNTNYKLRVASRVDLAAQRSFNIQAFTPNGNDECNMATTIPIEVANPINTTYNNAGSTLSVSASCENNNYTDMWFDFTMPVTGNVRITNTYGNDSFTLYDACNGTEIQCGFGNEYYYNLQQNINYKLRVASRVDLIANRSFNIQAFLPNGNDECNMSTTIPIEVANPVNTAYNNAGSTLSVSASCENNIYTDMWFDFTMPITGNVRITSTYGNDSFTLYDACNGTEIQCGFGNEYYYNLQQNTNYKLRVASRVDLIANRSFNIQAFEANINDDCNMSTEILIETENVVTTSYNNAGSMQSTIQGSCENTNFEYNDLWYNFTMPVNGNVFITSAYGNDSFTLYDGCGMTEIQCGFGTETYINLSQNTNYVLRVASRVDLIAPRSFSIRAFEAIPNQTCATATPIQVANLGDCASQNNVVDMRGATPSTNLSSCVTQSQEYYDAWFTFQAPLTGNITLNTGEVFDNYALYDACNGTEITCFNNDGSMPVVFGNTYYLQLLKRTVFLDEVTFCLEGAPEVAPGMANVCETLPNVTISAAEGNTNDWVPILDTNGNIAAAINANGNDLGVIASTLFIDNADTRTVIAQPYLRRELSLTPENQPTSNVSIRLYVLQDEMDDLIAADPNMVNYLFLDMMKVAGSGCTTGYTGGGDFLSASSSFYGSDYYSQFSTNSFSVFYPSSTNLSETLSTQSFDTALGIKIYPTVSNGIINIKAEDNLEQANISVLDVNGKTVFSSEVDLGANPIQLNLENRTKGLYFLKLEHNGSTEVQKIILR
ncbi:T9SS type A sorting domain-containing protein [Lacinutrix salivirga]